MVVWLIALPQGFRACMRCRPLGRLDQTDPAITRLLAQLEVQPMRRWSEADLVQMGLDPSTVRRGFKRHFGATFLQLARQRRVQMGLRALSTGDKVIDAQLTAGFSSPSAFRLAFAQLMGQAPGSLKRDAVLKAGCIDTPLGPMLAVADAKVLHLLEFIDRRALRGELARLRSRTGAEVGMGHSEPMAQVEAELVEYFDGKRAQFEVALAEHGSSFERAVWADLRASSGRADPKLWRDCRGDGATGCGACSGAGQRRKPVGAGDSLSPGDWVGWGTYWLWWRAVAQATFAGNGTKIPLTGTIGWKQGRPDHESI